MGPLRAASCTAHTAVAVTFGWVPKSSGMHPTRTPLIRHLHLYWSSQLNNVARDYNLPSWWPSNDWLHPALLSWGCMWGGLSVYMSKVNPYKYLWNFSTTAHWRVRNSNLCAGSGIWPYSSFYLHRLLLPQCCPLGSDRGQLPNQCHKHQYEAWMAW